MEDKIPALPYDVFDEEEARACVKGRPDSFLNIDRPETQFPTGQDMYAPKVYERAASMFSAMLADGRFIIEDKSCYYIYELTMDGRSQTGIVAVASIDDYLSGVIKKHENTREEKEQDRIRHVDALSAQTGPIFLAYRSIRMINDIVSRTKQDAEAKGTLLCGFEGMDGAIHRAFVIRDEDDIAAITRAFSDIESIYIADGHHRAASAVKVGLMRRESHPDYTGDEEFNYFLSVLFPHDELMIMDYNRVVKDLNGLTEAEFLGKLRSAGLHNSAPGALDGTSAPAPIRPSKKGQFSMYLGGRWYLLEIPDEMIPHKDPVASLDVSLLQNLVLSPILSIGDPRTDERIDFVGGIRGLKELERRCQRDCAVAFAMYPTDIRELFDVADAGLLMPPKSTWFEPKLLSGLFIHEIER